MRGKTSRQFVNKKEGEKKKHKSLSLSPTYPQLVIWKVRYSSGSHNLRRPAFFISEDTLQELLNKYETNFAGKNSHLNRFWLKFKLRDERAKSYDFENETCKISGERAKRRESGKNVKHFQNWIRQKKYLSLKMYERNCVFFKHFFTFSEEKLERKKTMRKNYNRFLQRAG